MPALELIAGQATAPGGTLTALAMNTGNTNTIRNTPVDTKIILLAIWALTQAKGQFQVRSPRLHDNIKGITLNSVANDADILYPVGQKQNLISQDTLNLLISGSAVAGEIEQAALLLYYPELPGIAGRFITPDELLQKTKNIMTVQNNITPGITGDYSGSQAINTTDDNFKANTDYALIGYQCDVALTAIRWIGADLGNIGVGGPGNQADKMITRDWFVNLSKHYNLPLIPVFNSANKSAILVDVMTNQAVVTPTINSIFAELSG